MVFPALLLILIGFAAWRAKQPAQPLKVRMVNYHVVQIACIVVILLMGAHLLTLLMGGSPASQQLGGRPY